MRFTLLFFLILSCSLTSIAQKQANIKLQSATDNQKFDLAKEKGKFVALHFLLKTECPYCIRHTQDYFKRASELKNVVQIFIKPDTEFEIRAWSGKLAEANMKHFPIFRDPDAKLAKQLNIPDGYKFHNQLVHYPATVLFNPEGKEVYRYVGKKNSDRLSFDDLASKVEELSKK